MEQNRIVTLFARQGIYDRAGAIYAYELLYRNSDENNRSFGDEATSSILTQLFSNLDIETITDNKRIYINFTHNHLVKKIPSLLPKEKIGIEVLESVIVDKDLLDSLHFLKEQGYKISLDDFIFDENTAPLVEFADIIKIDVLEKTEEKIVEQLNCLKQYKGKLLAEKIEDKAKFKLCLALGFDYFQGFFFQKPDILKGQLITENKANLLRLFSELSDENISIAEIEEFILTIPKLSYRILRLANSAAAYRGKKIDSLIDAIQKMGIQQIRDWLSMFLLSSQNDVAPDLLERTLIRAKMCEYLAKHVEYPDSHEVLTVGILSTLDMFLNESMESLLAKIQIKDSIKKAILYHDGISGSILLDTINYEKANFAKLEHLRYAKQDLIQAYLEGLEYAHSIMPFMK
ncbi:MAG: HDOD domain-containing protein [Proteobacteria bacterium]|nr:HDOD domain-containing protein [Pseudomonadota bacterium]